MLSILDLYIKTNAVKTKQSTKLKLEAVAKTSAQLGSVGHYVKIRRLASGRDRGRQTTLILLGLPEKRRKQCQRLPSPPGESVLLSAKPGQVR